MIICGDCLEVMRSWPDPRFHLIFADPPFRAGKEYADGYDDAEPLEVYRAKMKAQLAEMSRLLLPGGTLWLMQDQAHLGFCQMALEELGLTWLNTIVWAYTNPTPAAGHLPKTWRPILLFTKERAEWLDVDADQLGRPTLYYNPDRSATRPVHDMWPDCPKLVGGIFAQPELMTTPEGRFAHLAQMPERIAERILKLASHPGQQVLDPFAGSGTFIAVAERLGREWTGIEISPTYCNMIGVRLARQRERGIQYDMRLEA